MRPFRLYVLLAVLAPFPLNVAVAGTPLPDAPHVVVTGKGEVSAKPDRVEVQFEFSDRAAQPLPAKQAVDAAVNRLLDRLGDFDVADEDVKASGLDAGEDVSFGDDGLRVSNGYYANRSVTVTLRDVGRFGEFLDAGLEAGADRIGNVAFESSRADALRREAKARAVEDARREADEVARSFGTRLGPVYSIDSVGSRQASGYALDRIEVTGSRMRRARYIQPSVEYSASVSAVFELQR
ncbi:SIMPL domain-containing protein [Marilutibacter chinensis]|uniref:SIMPL domain-containing protein n=1 Tax=Marilutibacter chinensis TaxID=2912247 RepID=A0ABS9HST4_9GAMM|nr:SIMPL domain-containing protein [Lysobacter chinensis]MCF7221743.1 SIMPL domain-containing protein [Lysobacter chinensis]